MTVTGTKILFQVTRRFTRSCTIMLATVIPLAVALPAPGQSSDDTIQSDPYVILFRTKLEEASSDVTAKEASLALAQLRYQQVQRLITQGAASEDEYNSTKAGLVLAKAEFASAQQRVLARKAMLDVVILNRLAGREVQQCL